MLLKSVELLSSSPYLGRIGENTAYEGYTAFEYLNADTDYEAFDLPEIHSGFDPYRVPLADEDEPRADRIAESATIVSLHEHAFSFPERIKADTPDYVRESRAHTPYEYLAESNLDGVFDIHFDGFSGITRRRAGSGMTSFTTWGCAPVTSPTSSS